jgi:hypothetical protein
MSRIALAIALAGLGFTPTGLCGQGVELGTRVGFNIVLPEDGSIIGFGIPGGGPAPLGSLFGGASSVHVAFFPSEQVMLEPQLSLSVLRVSNGSSETLLNATLASQVAYMFSGASVSSGYLGGNLALTVIDVSGADSENDFALGFAVGYRALPTPNVAVRIEGGYRRWLDFELNELNAALIFGIVIP